jgi:hypothetical protein
LTAFKEESVMSKRRPILIVQLRRQSPEQAQRTTAQIGAVPGVIAVNMYGWRMGARNLTEQAQEESVIMRARRKSAQRRRRKPEDERPGAAA